MHYQLQIQNTAHYLVILINQKEKYIENEIKTVKITLQCHCEQPL
jgi:hypothetical protein